MAFVFVYGTLKRGHGNHPLLGDSLFVGEATTLGKYTLYDGGFPRMSNFPGDVKSYVAGEVFHVTSAAVLDGLDRLEGHPTFYIRRRIWVRMTASDSHQRVWAYIWPHPHASAVCKPIKGVASWDR